MCVLYACISQTFEPGGQVHQPGPFLDQATGGPNSGRVEWAGRVPASGGIFTGFLMGFFDGLTHQRLG